MKKTLIIITVFLACSNCTKKPKFKPSFKAIKSNKEKILEYYDSIGNISSNYKTCSFIVDRCWSL